MVADLYKTGNWFEIASQARNDKILAAENQQAVAGISKIVCGWAAE
jgi:hypothetical protein